MGIEFYKEIIDGIGPRTLCASSETLRTIANFLAKLMETRVNLAKSAYST